MSGFYTISWSVWSVWATLTAAGCLITLANLRRASDARERRAAGQGLIILLAILTQIILTALVPLPPEPAQLWRVFVGRGASMIIVFVVIKNALSYKSEITEHEAHKRRDERIKDAGVGGS